MSYLVYYLVPILLWQLSGYPEVLVLILVVVAAQRVLPDPYLWFKYQRRMRSLRIEIAANPENVTARRDLAMIWLDKRRPRRALPLLAEATRREPDSAQLLYLTGQALLQSGDAQGALGPLVQALQKQERMHYGEGYLLCGRALLKLGRHAEAEDSLLRVLKINTSSVEGFVLLARARKKQGDLAGGKQARRQALDTFGQVPGYRRRHELLWYLRALFL